MKAEPAVLIIDDDGMVRRAFRRVLERSGLRVIEAEDGSSGLAASREYQPGAVLLDLRMPGMDGLDVLSSLMEERPETAVLVVSGEGTMTDVVQALRRGAWDFVSKPVPDPELLVRMVRRGLEKAALARQNREYAESLREMNERLTSALEELRSDAQAARQLQFQLLPKDGLRIGSYTCFRRLFPSQLMSGDFLDYFALGDRCVGFYLADVAGHGAASAFITAILTTLVHNYRERLASSGDRTILNPQRFLTSLDADLMAHGLNKHITMFFGVLDDQGHLAYGNAGGFPFPFVSNGAGVSELECCGRPLNLPCGASFGSGEAELPPGGRLLLVSDGVLELAPKESHRERRHKVGRMLADSADLDHVLRSLGLEESTPLSDDVALLYLQREEHDA